MPHLRRMTETPMVFDRASGTERPATEHDLAQMGLVPVADGIVDCCRRRNTVAVGGSVLAGDTSIGGLRRNRYDRARIRGDAARTAFLGEREALP